MNQFNADCVTCRYWQAKIDDQRERALKGDGYSYRRQMKAGRELTQHLDHGDHVFGEQTNVLTEGVSHG